MPCGVAWRRLRGETRPGSEIGSKLTSIRFFMSQQQALENRKRETQRRKTLETQLTTPVTTGLTTPRERPQPGTGVHHPTTLQMTGLCAGVEPRARGIVFLALGGGKEHR